MGKIKKLRRSKVALIKSKKASDKQSVEMDTRALDEIKSLTESGEFNEATRRAEDLQVLFPDSPLIHCIIGDIHLKQRKFDKAAESYRSALKHDKRNVVALLKIGTLNERLGMVEEAAAVYNKVLQMAPNNVDALNGLGRQFCKSGNIGMARDIFEKVLRLDQNSAEALYGLGQVHDLQGMASEAEMNYRLAIVNKPGYSEAHNSLGIVQARQGRYDEAEYSYKRALESQSNNVDVLNDLGELYEKSNRLGESKDVVARALEISPGNISATRIMATLLRRQGKHREALQLLESVSVPENMPAKASEIHYELAKIHDRLGRFEEAFRHFALTKTYQGLELQSQKFSKDNFLRRIERIREFFTKERLQEMAADQTPSSDEAPLFLVGFPRSGTTLMDQIIDTHPDFCVAEETAALDLVIEKINWLGRGYPEALENLSGDQLEELRRDYYANLKKFSGQLQGGRIIDKYPLHIIHLGLIFKMFPNARIIVALRHPYDVCLSNFMQLFRLNDAMANFTNLPDTACCYDKVMGLALHYMQHLPLKLHLIKYEDLIEDFTGTTGEMFDFLGADWDEKVVKYYEHAKAKKKILTPSYQQVTEPIYKRSVNRYLNYFSFFSEVSELLYPYIEHFGYEISGKSNSQRD